MPQETLYTARFPYPDEIVRAKAQTIECAVYRDGALVAPASGTVTVYDEGGSEIVDAAAVTVASSIATYAITAAMVPATLSLSDDWAIHWNLTFSSGQVDKFRRAACLVKASLKPVITDADLTDVHTEQGSWISGSTAQSYIDAGWRYIMPSASSPSAS